MKNRVQAGRPRGGRAGRQPAAERRTHNGETELPGASARTAEALAAWIPFWRELELLTRYQRSVWGNLMPPWSEAWQNLFRLAPERLWQSILPWSFSAFQFTNEIQGDPELEYKILTRVAGYGSQLGTVMDFLEVMANRIQPPLKSGQNEAALFKVLKFYDLLNEVNKAKGVPEAAVETG